MSSLVHVTWNFFRIQEKSNWKLRIYLNAESQLNICRQCRDHHLRQVPDWGCLKISSWKLMFYIDCKLYHFYRLIHTFRWLIAEWDYSIHVCLCPSTFKPSTISTLSYPIHFPLDNLPIVWPNIFLSTLMVVLF